MMSQFLLCSGTVGLPAVGKVELGRLPSCSYYPKAPAWRCKPCVDLRNALVAWKHGQKTRADGWPKFQSDYGECLQCTCPSTHPPLPKVSVRWGGLPEQVEVVVTNPIALCEPCFPSHNTPPPCKKRRAVVCSWQHKLKASHAVEVATLTKELIVSKEKLKRSFTVR